METINLKLTVPVTTAQYMLRDAAESGDRALMGQFLTAGVDPAVPETWSNDGWGLLPLGHFIVGGYGDPGINESRLGYLQEWLEKGLVNPNTPCYVEDDMKTTQALLPFLQEKLESAPRRTFLFERDREYFQKQVRFWEDCLALIEGITGSQKGNPEN